MDFSSRLKHLRMKQKLTQEQLGEKVNVTKVSISGYESGNRNPDMGTLQKLADYFKVSVDYLLGRTDDISSDDKKNIASEGRAFFGGANKYTEEELEIAEAAAKAAIEAYRKGLNKKQ